MRRGKVTSPIGHRNKQASSANPIGITQKGASQCTLLHHNAAYHQDNGKRAKGKPEAPKAQFTTLLHRPEAVRADHSQHPKGTRFPIQQQADPTERDTAVHQESLGNHSQRRLWTPEVLESPCLPQAGPPYSRAGKPNRSKNRRRSIDDVDRRRRHDVDRFSISILTRALDSSAQSASIGPIGRSIDDRSTISTTSIDRYRRSIFDFDLPLGFSGGRPTDRLVCMVCRDCL